MIKKLLKYILFSLIFLIPSTVLAGDLDITCYEDQSPVILKNTNPLFQLTGFLPGNSASRTIYVKNTDPTNACKIYFDISGTTNALTNKIEVHIPSLFNDSLSEYITGDRILMADLQPNEEITRTITLEFPSDAGNPFTLKQASFDITIQSVWGPEFNTTGDVEGVTDTSTDSSTKRTPLEYISDLLGTGGEDFENEDTTKDTNIEEEEVVLGEEDSSCTTKTLWWIPLIVQLILTILVISIDKSVLRKKYVKLLISILLGMISYLVINKIGCGCNPVWLCTNHWILNLIITSLPLLLYIQRKRTIDIGYSETQQTL